MANLTGMALEIIDQIALQLPKQDFHNFRSTMNSQIRDGTQSEFAFRYCRQLDADVLMDNNDPPRRDLASTNVHLTVTGGSDTRANMVRSINFHSRDGWFNTPFPNQHVQNIMQVLALTPNAATVAIRTHRQRASDVLFQSLWQTAALNHPIRHLTITSESWAEPDRVRATRLQIIRLLKQHANTLETLTLDSAMLIAADWEPIWVTIRDKMNLRRFDFGHCRLFEQARFQLVPLVPLFTLPAGQTVQVQYAPGESYLFSGSTAQMQGVQTIKAGANRLLLMFNSVWYDRNKPT